MLAVESRCEMFPSSREANSCFEEETASTFGEERSVDTHLCQWLVSVSFNSIFEGNVFTKITAQSPITFAFLTLFTFSVELQNTQSAK